MNAFEITDTGIRVAPGRYVAVAQDWSHTLPDPRQGASRHDELYLNHSDEPAIRSHDDLQVLVLPVGKDAAGCPGRAIAIGGSTVVAFERLALVPLEDAQRRHYPYASHIDMVVPLTVPVEGVVRLVDGDYELDGFEGVDAIDTRTPGAFTIEGTMFDMAHEETAAIFGYGTPAFNERLDEHGFACDLKALRERLAGRTDPEAVSVLNRLPKVDFAIAYYAPVQP